ncbi:histidinol-phosphatase [Rubritalea sp.]|uniref:histidinol-phosphatase n=1 Tax=Rubritalea sp. TaxID=2109375 RepID=UPI003EF1C918
MPADYHTHTPLCMHAEGEPEQYIDAAIAAGVTEYGISDHAPVGEEFFDDWRMLESQLPEYFSWVERAKAHAGDKLPVRVGMECDWLPGCESWIQDLRSRYDWDYLIGSVHYINDQWDFDNPKWVGSKWAEADIDQVWETYWSTYIDMIDSGLFDIFGHPDLIKKFGHKPAGDLSRFYEPAIDALATSGAIIELNTAGWHKPCAEQYPHSEFLELARDGGIGLVISSDAHHPAEVARDFEKAKAVAKAAGYMETVLIDKGQRSYENL